MNQLATVAFPDHFSAHAATYATYRPRYPAALFHWLAVMAPGTALAWDAGTGSGQVATGLVTRFSKVIATDASAAQIACAVHHARIAYAVAQYESGIPSHSVQLVTVGQALHWFDVDAFCREVRRVLQPGGVLAAFAYVRSSVTPEVDALVRYHRDITLGRYWPPEHFQVQDEYRAIALPIDEFVVPSFEMSEDWTLEQYLGFLRSWSATQRLIAARGEGPVLAFEHALSSAWGDYARRTVRWPLFVRAGEVR